MINVIRLWLVNAAVLALLAGCSAMNQLAGLGVISEETSGFDNRKIIEVSGNNVMGAQGGFSTFGGITIGGRWESTDQDNFFFTLLYEGHPMMGGGYTSFREFSVNIDGEVKNFQITAETMFDRGPYNSVSGGSQTYSKSGFVMQLSYLKHMLDAKQCKVRVVTSDGYAEGDFTIASNAGSPTAKASLQQFYNRVMAHKAPPSSSK